MPISQASDTDHPNKISQFQIVKPQIFAAQHLCRFCMAEKAIWQWCFPAKTLSSLSNRSGKHRTAVKSFLPDRISVLAGRPVRLTQGPEKGPTSPRREASLINLPGTFVARLFFVCSSLLRLCPRLEHPFPQRKSGTTIRTQKSLPSPSKRIFMDPRFDLKTINHWR